MNRLTLGALAALAATQVAGCIIHDNTPHDIAHTITATWALKRVNEAPVACPSSISAAVLYTQPVDANGNDIGTPGMDVFSCDVGSGVSQPLPPGQYLTWIEITDDPNSSLYYARSLSAYVDITVEDKTFSTSIYQDGGHFQIGWELQGVSGRPLECSDVGGIDEIKVTSFLSTSIQGIEDRYHCEDHVGITAPLPNGNYDVLVDTLDGGNRIGPGYHFANLQTIFPQNQVTDLGTVLLPIDGL